MIVRETLYSSPGGDTIQIEMTAKHLRLLGASIDISFSNKVLPYKDYDLLHFFNIIRPDDILPHIDHEIPFVISTIFVDYSEYERNRHGMAKYLFKILNPGYIEYLKAIARLIKNGDKIKSKYYFFNGHKKSIKYLLKKTKLTLPNSHSEHNRLKNYTGLNFEYRKVVNAIDTAVFDTDVKPNEQFANHIICVGRIEGRKNQLNLIKAVAGTGLNLTIIGRPSPNHLKYYNACVREAGNVNNVQFIEHISHDDLVSIYSAAKVHVLPSWFETTGLSSLEAAAMNCNVVITKKGDAEEYFDQMAFYCEPDDINSIREAILRAYHSDVNNDLRRHILTHFSWNETAVQTFSAYNEILMRN